MKAFSELRAKARLRRDKLIGQARDEYSATLTRIANLEQDLLGRESSSHPMKRKDDAFSENDGEWSLAEWNGRGGCKLTDEELADL